MFDRSRNRTLQASLAAVLALGAFEARAAPGDAHPINGFMTADKFGRFFRNAPSDTLRVDENGETLWTHVGARSLECGRASSVVVAGPAGLAALDPETGADLWSSPLVGTLSCVNDELILVRDLQSLAACTAHALDRATGAEVWTHEGCGDVRGGGSSVVFAERDNGHTRLDFVDARTGVAGPSTLLPSNVTVSGNREAVFAVFDQKLARLDEETGQPLWQVEQLGGSVPPSFEAGLVLQHDSQHVISLDPATGERRFTLSGWPMLSIVKELIVATTLDGSTARVEARTFDGDVQWTRDFDTGARTFVGADSIFIAHRSTIESVDAATGTAVWTQDIIPPGGFAATHIARMIGSDASSIYVTAVAGGGRFSPMTLTALDKATGAVRWSYEPNDAVNELGATETSLLVTIGYFAQKTMRLEK